MFGKKIKREYELVKAFQGLFNNADGTLKADAKVVLEFLRDEAGARGELGCGGIPYFYDSENRFDVHAAAFLLGKRRIFDLIVKYLALDETEVFTLTSKGKRTEEDICNDLNI